MPVALAAEVTTFAEASAVGLDTEMYTVAECRNTYIVRLEIDSDLYKIFASSTSDRGNYFFKSEANFQHQILSQFAWWI